MRGWRTKSLDDQLRTLADGNQIPLLGLGVWQIPNGPTTVNAVRWALELGYRHIDTAQAYGNEESVGRALKESGVPRDQVLLTTKFWPRAQGYARSIGVSNFDVRDMEQVIAVATVPPAVNQVQLSPFEYRRKLLDAAEKRGVAVEAYSPLGTGRHLEDETVKRLASRIGRTPAQVLIRWGLQHNLVVIPKSTHRKRIEENARIFDFTLSAGDMAELDALDDTGGTDRALEETWW